MMAVLPFGLNEFQRARRYSNEGMRHTNWRSHKAGEESPAFSIQAKKGFLTPLEMPMLRILLSNSNALRQISDSCRHAAIRSSTHDL
jgi:hypothetical protein